ncbi:hypothetical protein [Burkholderia cenocepacia]|uniref:hypothetical protein n=1 Tax=Burkholderia cenocepacia TaxID=95486 RepID=UPI0021184D13|nr:hypothetical protein [Burkholderia cenocepacia]
MKTTFSNGGKLSVLGLIAVVYSATVTAAPMNADVVDSVMGKYQAAASAWGSVMVNYASWLFWGLALIRDGFIKTDRPAEGYSSRSDSNRV